MGACRGSATRVHGPWRGAYALVPVRAWRGGGERRDRRGWEVRSRRAVGWLGWSSERHEAGPIAPTSREGAKTRARKGLVRVCGQARSACVRASLQRVRMRGRPVAGVESSTALMPRVSSQGGEPETRTRMHRGLAQVENAGRGCRRLGAGGTAYGRASETRCGDGAAQRPETLSRRVEESSTHGEWRTLLHV
jgi:hypothetical protein